MNDYSATSAWPESFEILLRRAVPDWADGTAIRPDAQLLNGGLDSLAAAGLINDIEEDFGVVFDEDLSDPRLLTTAGYLWSVTSRLLARRPPDVAEDSPAG